MGACSRAPGHTREPIRSSAAFLVIFVSSLVERPARVGAVLDVDRHFLGDASSSHTTFLVVVIKDEVAERHSAAGARRDE